IEHTIPVSEYDSSALIQDLPAPIRMRAPRNQQRRTNTGGTRSGSGNRKPQGRRPRQPRQSAPKQS
ncbi:RNA helicase, partial [Vibrio parahaemolyticus]|nr:RNA helicase [Vibrio parahaemolyticus]